MKKLILTAAVLGLCAGSVAVVSAAEPGVAPAADPGATLRTYCFSCHNERLKAGGLALDRLDLAHVVDNGEVWEKVIRKVRVGLMPPQGLAKPDPPAQPPCFPGLRTPWIALPQPSQIRAGPWCIV